MKAHALTIALLLIWNTEITANASSTSRETTVARLGAAELTLADIDAMAHQLPADVRGGVFDNPTRIGEMLETLLVRRAMVQPLLTNPPDYLDLAKLRKEAERKMLVERALRHAIESLPEPDFQAQAEAYYDQNPQEFVVPATVSVRHVLIGTEDADSSSAYQRAQELRSSLIAGQITFDQAVAEFSTDPAKNRNKGRYPRVKPGAMVPQFEAAAFALSDVGDLSQPVRTQFGYHLILLEERHPPETQSRATAIIPLREKYRQEYLKRRNLDYIESLGDNPKEKLFQMAREQGFDDDPDLVASVQLELEEMTLELYREHYLDRHLKGDFQSLAREYYLTHKDQFQRPAAVTAVQIEVPKQGNIPAELAEIARLKDIADSNVGAQTLIALTPPNAKADQVVFVEGDSTTARATRIAFSLKQPGDCADVVELAQSYLVICLVRKHPVLTKSFIEIRKPLMARMRNKQETQVWSLHINEFHQLPFEADPDIVASLRTRYFASNNAL